MSDLMSVIAPKPAVDSLSPSVSWSQRLNGYGALFVTGAVFLLLGLAMAVTAWRGDQQTFGNLVETVKSLAMVAGGFWLRSLSSPKKDDTIALLGSALATSTPAAPPEPPRPAPAAPPPPIPPAAGAERSSPDAEIEALRPQQPQP